MNEKITYEVRDHRKREFIETRGINEASKIADQIKGQVWLVSQTAGEPKAYCMILT